MNTIKTFVLGAVLAGTTMGAERLASAQGPSAPIGAPPAVELASSVSTAPTTNSEAAKAPPMFELSLKAGGHFPQVTNHLGTNFDAILKFGVGVAVERRLQIFAELGYTQPTHETTSMDPRLGMTGGAYTSTLTVRELAANLGAQFFFTPLSSFVLPYAGLAVQAHFVKSEVVGSSMGTPFGENDETSTQLGGAAFGGIGLHLGPGLLLGELRFAYAGIGQKVTGQANIGALSALLGYGLMF